MAGQELSTIRNFCIIAHIDHGKSTLADRMLEITKTVEERKMREQYLDTMELERERGITIKMQPVRMVWKPNHAEIPNYKFQITNKFQNSNEQKSKRLGFGAWDLELANSKQEFVLNLIDTPGHVDFSYEVSRALAAVEGAVLLVDATKGVQAQTLSNLETAKSLGVMIVPAVNKIDLPHARVEETKKEIASLLKCGEEDVLEVSGKTGEGVEELLEMVVKKVPPPASSTSDVGEKTSDVFPAGGPLKALIFDFDYSEHRGIIAHVRVFEGGVAKNDKLEFTHAGGKFAAGEVGVFSPELKEAESLRAGEIGYIVTGVKEAKVVRVGDTITKITKHKSQITNPLPGYKEVEPVVFSSIFPAEQDRFEDLKKALERLRLVDSSLFFEEESAGVLGRGFRCGFLGMLHLEIVLERLRRDFKIEAIAATPTVKYKLKTKSVESEVYSPAKFPEGYEALLVREPWISMEVLLPPENLSGVLKLLKEHDAEVGNTDKFSESRMRLEAAMPLRELMRDFFDDLKSVSSGFASLSYKMAGDRQADLTRMDILVAEEAIPAFAKIVPRHRVEREAEAVVEKLYKILPQAMFALKIQARAQGRIISSRAKKALSKDVTGYLYGGDRTRKMKLWKKQKAGKKKLKEKAEFNIPPDVYLKMIRK